MAGMTAASSIADALKTQAIAGVQQSLFLNNEVFSLFPIVELTGGSTLNVKHHYSGNASVGTYVEGDAMGSPGSQSYLTASWPVAYYKGVGQITGHARDQLRNGAPGAEFYDQIAMEFSRLAEDMIDKSGRDMLSTGTTAPVGIQGIVSSSNTIAGLSQVTYTWFASYKNAAAGTTIAIVDLDTFIYLISDANYGGVTDMILMSWKQQMKLKGVIGNAGTTANSIQLQVPGGPSGGTYTMQTGNVRDTIYVGNIPVRPVRNLTNSIVLGLQSSDWLIGRQRDWRVEMLGKTDDSDKFLMTGAFGLVCKNPKHQWQMTTLSA